MKNNTKTIGEYVKIAREQANLSQQQLAEIMGFKSATAISLIESNERKLSAENLKVLAEKLNKTVDYFFGGIDDHLNVQVALRADKNLNQEDQDAILRFIELAKKNHGK